MLVLGREVGEQVEILDQETGKSIVITIERFLTKKNKSGQYTQVNLSFYDPNRNFAIIRPDRPDKAPYLNKDNGKK